MNGKNFLFTSESVCAGHPDKICDFISDSILDAALRQDQNSKTAIECMAGHNRLIIAGEITTKADINYKNIAKKKISELGYSDPNFNFSDKAIIETYVHAQSSEILSGVKKKGAGDQGMMFGFAIKETENLMPLPIEIAHNLAKKLDESKKGNLIYLRPDGKTQVTLEYKNGKPYSVKQIVIAVPHNEEVELNEVKNDLFKFVVKPTIEEYGFNLKIKDFILNGTGIWHMPGPTSDCGLTGRKIIVDTYGGYSRVGGGAFSGKDASKVDRSGAYAARFLAKNIVANGLAEKAEVRLAYFIGGIKPVMQDVETFGTEKKSMKIIKSYMDKILDTSVDGIINKLDLKKPIFSQTSSYGHFGRSKFPWEKIVN